MTMSFLVLSESPSLSISKVAHTCIECFECAAFVSINLARSSCLLYWLYCLSFAFPDSKKPHLPRRCFGHFGVYEEISDGSRRFDRLGGRTFCN